MSDPTSDAGSPPSASSSKRRETTLRLPQFTSIQSSKGSRRGLGQADGSAQDSDASDSDDDEAKWIAAHSGPQTPNIAEAASQLRKSLSVHGLSELSNMPRAELRKSVGSKVWRPHDEAARLPADWERLAVHVFRGAVRAFNLAFGLRGTIMLLLTLIKGLRKRKVRAKDLSQAVFSAPNLRFGIMFGLWAALYKSVHNSLRLLTPVPQRRPSRAQSDASHGVTAQHAVPISKDPSPQSADMSQDEGSNLGSGRASGTTTPRSGYHELQGKTDEEKSKLKSRQKRRAFMRDPRSKIYHAYIAGAVSALAVMVETKDNRISLAQQLFVRGLEGTYNVAHSKNYINIPHGAVIAFGLACGQIMWAWLNAPETLPKGYVSWITNASMVAPGSTPVYRHVRDGTQVPVDDVIRKWFPQGKLPDPIGKTSAGLTKYPAVPPTPGNRRGITARNATNIIAWLEKAKKGQNGDHVLCELIHPWEDNHWFSPLDRFLEVTRWILPVYLTLHFVPAIFLRTGSFLRSPVRVFLRSLFGSVRSSSFLGVFVIIFQTMFCIAHSSHDWILSNPNLRSIVPQWALNILKGGTMHWVAGFLTSLSLFVDHARRRAELAAYVLPKGMESAWSVGRKRGWAPFVPGGDLLLTSVGMSLVMGTYARSPEHLSGLVRRVVFQFIGRN